jgi:hypothetical protein
MTLFGFGRHLSGKERRSITLCCLLEGITLFVDVVEFISEQNASDLFFDLSVVIPFVDEDFVIVGK